MLEYCQSDFDILRKACLTFRRLLWHATCTEALMEVKKKKKTVKEMTVVGVDQFQYTTIASVCMGVFLKHNSDKKNRRSKLMVVKTGRRLDTSMVTWRS